MVQRCGLCRSRNKHLLAKFGFDTAENEPCKVCPLSAYRSPRCIHDHHWLHRDVKAANIMFLYSGQGWNDGDKYIMHQKSSRRIKKLFNASQVAKVEHLKQFEPRHLTLKYVDFGFATRQDDERGLKYANGSVYYYPKDQTLGSFCQLLCLF